MTTVVVAARQPQSQRCYRSLLEQVAVEAQFVTDVDSLIRCVRSRPVDLVIFDIDDPHLPVGKWMDAARRDSDLGLVPVLWIGSGVSESDLQAVQEYRPGLHLAQSPDAKTMSRALESLAGGTRLGGKANPSASQPLKSSTWTPEMGTIDDALSIFTDPAKGQESGDRVHDTPIQVVPGSSGISNPKNVRGVMHKDAGEDYDWFIEEMKRTETAAGRSRSDSVSTDVGGPHANEEGILLAPLPGVNAGRESDPDDAGVVRMEQLALEDRPATGPFSAAPAGTGTALPGTLPSGFDDAFVDRIAKEVACQLAVDLLRSLDQDAIRHAVEAALAKPR